MGPIDPPASEDGTHFWEWFAITNENKPVCLLEYGDQISSQSSTHVITFHDFLPHVITLTTEHEDYGFSSESDLEMEEKKSQQEVKYGVKSVINEMSEEHESEYDYDVMEQIRATKQSAIPRKSVTVKL